MTYSKSRLKPISIHLIWWLAYVTYEVLVSAVVTRRFSHFTYYLLFYTINISLFYIHARLVLPIAIRDTLNTLWRLPLLLILEIGIYFGLAICVTLQLEYLGLRHSPLVFDFKFFTGVFWRGMLFLLYGTGYYFVINYIKKKELTMEKALEVQQLKMELLMIEKDFLRSQINPHLLFNTLNFIKYAAKKHPEHADEAILRLSEIMSFALERKNRDTIHIKDELKQVENMIRLNQLRFDNKLQIQYHFEIHDVRAKFIPVVLLTLAENIFKHGDLFDLAYPATIKVRTSEAEIFITTTNSAALTAYSENKHSGLKNIASRLAIAYPGTHQFVYGFEGTVFNTMLTVQHPELVYNITN